MNNEPAYYVILSRSDQFDLTGLADLLSRSLCTPRFDVITHLKHSWGLLHKAHMIAKAEELQQKLAQAGIETFILSATELKTVPHPMVLKKAIPEPGGLVFQEEGQNKFLAWNDITLLCAGEVEETIQMKETLPSDGKAMKWMARTGLSVTTAVAIAYERSKKREVTKERTDSSYYLDLIAKGGLKSVRILGNSFDYSYLGGRMGYNALINFKNLALDIAKFLPNVTKNQGMRAMENKTVMRNLKYGGLKNFENEKLWLMQLNP